MGDYDKVSPETKRLGNLYLFIDKIGEDKLSKDERELYNQILFSEPNIVGEWEQKSQELAPQELEDWFLSTMNELVGKYIGKFLDQEVGFESQDRYKLDESLKLPVSRKKIIGIILNWQRGDSVSAHNDFIDLYDNFQKKQK